MPRTIIEQGARIDGFTVGQLVHQGGMARLWRVTREGDDRPMVLKAPLIREGDDATSIVGFEVEQMILPTVSGPHVPAFVAAGDAEEVPYIVMEYIEGASLLDRFAHAPLPIDEVVSIGLRTATALHDLHRQKVLHLDLKPSNLMLRQSGEIAFIDFGLSRHLQLPDLLSEEFRLPLGTAPYMAPEQVLGRRDEPRSDIFALGVLLYHLTTGERPFGNPQRKSGLRQRLWQEPIPPRQHRPETPPWLQEIILRCLEVMPKARYATGAQLAFEISHPDQIRLTERAQRQTRSGFGATFRRWSRRGAVSRELLAAQTPVPLSSAPIVAVAVDLSPGMEDLQELLRVTARRILETLPGARLACVNVLKQHRIAMDFTLDSEGRNVHLQRLAELKHWARPLEEVAERVTWHVLEAVDPAAAIIEYAQTNHVDHILIGARANSTLRRYLGSVSAQVVAEAPCSVTVVRVPHYADSNAMPAEPGANTGRAA